MGCTQILRERQSLRTFDLSILHPLLSCFLIRSFPFHFCLRRQLWDPNALAMAAADAAASEATLAVLDARLVRVSRENAVANAESAVLELRSAKVAASLLEKAEQVYHTCVCGVCGCGCSYEK